MNQNSFVFVTSEQFPKIAQNLESNKPEQVRKLDWSLGRRQLFKI
jgi:hypothetical protein